MTETMLLGKQSTLELGGHTRDDGPVVHMSRKRNEVPLWHKTLLTLEEAAEYTGLGLQKLRDISDHDECKFVLWNGRKRLFKRVKLEEYLEKVFSL